MPLELTVEHLSVARNDVPVVSDVSFSVSAGRALIVRGANGAGKTTMLRALAGLLPTVSGRIALTGNSDGFTHDDEATVGERAHLVGHHNGIKAHMTVAENLRFWARFLGSQKRTQKAGATSSSAGGNAATEASVEAALAAFDLLELADIPTGLLSAGQKRRTGLARLIAAPRPIWLLDEPTTSLDTTSAERVSDAVNKHLADGGLAVVATHLPLDIAPADTMTMTSRTTRQTASQWAVAE